MSDDFHYRIVRVDGAKGPHGHGRIVAVHAGSDDLDTAVLIYEWTRHKQPGRYIVLLAGGKVMRRSWTDHREG